MWILDGVFYEGDCPDGGIKPTYQELLDKKKEDVKTEMKIIRDYKESNEGFTYLGKVFDSDQLSMDRLNVAINSAIVAILTNNVFSVIWTCKDNSSITMSESELLGIPQAIAISKNNLHVRYRELKDLIDSLTTLEELDLITWDM